MEAIVIELSNFRGKTEFGGNYISRFDNELINLNWFRWKVVFRTPDILASVFLIVNMSLRSMILILITTIAFFWTISSNAYGTEDRFEIVGFVRESDIHSGTGIGGVRVCIDALDRCVETDARGFFRFPSLPSGIYQVRAEHLNYTHDICSTELTDGKKWCSISLHPGGGPATNSFAKAKPLHQYELVRTAMHTFFTPEFDEQYGVNTNLSGESSYDLNDCNNGKIYVPDSESTLLLAFADLGYRVSVWRRYFPRLGYPEDVWSPVVNNFEEKALDAILRTNGRISLWHLFPFHDDSSLGGMRPAINPIFERYRQSHPEVGVIVTHDSCGDNVPSLAVHTDPPGGRTIFIPTFFHALCKAQGMDPDDPSVCDRWREPLDGKLTYVAGDYFYRVEWSDGKVQSGRLQYFDYFDDKQVTFRKN